MKKSALVLLLATAVNVSACVAGPIFPDAYCPSAGRCDGRGVCTFSGNTVEYWEQSVWPKPGNEPADYVLYKADFRTEFGNYIPMCYFKKINSTDNAQFGVISRNPKLALMPSGTGAWRGDIFKNASCYSSDPAMCAFYQDTDRKPDVPSN